jgi:hypothetical protein
MGKKLIDRYSLLHFASGIVAYYFGLSLVMWLLLHASFEVLENTSGGNYFIDHYLTFWPGGKRSPDTLMNVIGDNLFAVLGWLTPYFIDRYTI